MPEFSLARTFRNRGLLLQTGSQFSNSANVNELLQVFGGGGHAATAGVRKRTNDVEKFRQEILERIVMMRKISGQDK